MKYECSVSGMFPAVSCEWSVSYYKQMRDNPWACMVTDDGTRRCINMQLRVRVVKQQ